MIKGKIMAEILIVEDEIKLRQELKVFLNNNGFKTKEIIDFDDTLKQMLLILLKQIYCLIINLVQEKKQTLNIGY